MGRVHKLMLRSCLKGICVGWTILALILLANFGNLRTIIFSSSNAVLATFLLMVGFAITFGNSAMGIAVMRIPKREEPET